MLDVSRSDLVAAVAGAGTMGRGIAQVLAQCGVRTLLSTRSPAPRSAASTRSRRRSPSSPRRAASRIRRQSRSASRWCRTCRRSRPARGDRGDHRGPGGEARAFLRAGNDRRRELHPRQQHLFAFSDGDGGGVQTSRPCRRLPLLQPGAGNEDRRGSRRRAHRALGDGRAHRACATLRPHAGALQGHAGLRRQPCRASVRAGVAAHPFRRHCRSGEHRPHPRRAAPASASARLD